MTYPPNSGKIIFMNEITTQKRHTVEVRNLINGINTSILSAKELDIFAAVLFKIQECHGEQIVMDKSELKYLADLSSMSGVKLRDVVTNFARKIGSLPYEYPDEQEEIDNIIFLFEKFSFDRKGEKLTILPTQSLADLLVFDREKGYYFRFIVEQSTKLKSKYAKKAYYWILEGGFRGEYTISVEKLRKDLGLSKNYKTRDIKKGVIDVMYKELSPIFKRLQIREIRASEAGTPQKGDPIVSYKFTYKRISTPREAEKVNAIIAERREEKIKRSIEQRSRENGEILVDL